MTSSTDRPSAEALSSIAIALVSDRKSVTIADVRTLYLFGPAYLPAVGNTDGTRAVVAVRTSLEAVLGDVRPRVGRDEDGRAAEYSLSGYWLAAAGYLMLVDQLSTMLEGGIEALLTSELCGLTAEEAGAICGCATRASTATACRTTQRR